MTVLYNENDPYAAAWLRELIKDGAIAPGVVDERSIEDLTAADVAGFTQVHFFAGIGGWSYALRLAGWPDDEPVWTGSCPCQPFSAAGKRQGVNDKRHLWPQFHRLIAECAPPVVFGEQVASKDGRLWLAGVRTDLEALGYAVGAADLCAAGVGAPHIRQRLYWVADSQRNTRDTRRVTDEPAEGDGAPSTGSCVNLDDAATLAGWPTPMAGAKGTATYNEAGNTDSSRKTVALVSGWNTPRATDGSNGGPNQAGGALPNDAMKAGWATPTRDYKDGASTLENVPINGLLGRQVSLSPAQTEKRGALNPAFSLWLMGFPIAWAHCAARVTRLSRKSPRSSSKPT